MGIEISLMVFHLLVKMQIEPPQGKKVEFTLKAKQAFSHIEIFKSTQKTRSSKKCTLKTFFVLELRGYEVSALITDDVILQFKSLCSN